MVTFFFLIFVSLFTIGCQTDPLAPDRPRVELIDELSEVRDLPDTRMQIILQRLQVTFERRPIQETRFTYYYWTIHLLQSLDFPLNDLNPWDIDGLTTLLFEEYPAGNFSGPYQQITIASSEKEFLVLQSSYFSMPGGTGTISPSPQGFIQMLELQSGLWFQFLLFPDLPIMTLDWWVELDQVLEARVEDYRATVNSELFPQPYKTPEIEVLQMIRMGRVAEENRARFKNLLDQTSNREKYYVLSEVYWWFLEQSTNTP